MAINIQPESDMETNGLKRSHDEFSGDEVTIDDRGLEAGVKQQATEAVVKPSKAVSPARQMMDRDSPPPQSSPDSLTDAGTNTPPRDSPSPSPTPTKSTSALKQTADVNSSSSNPPASNSTPSANQPAKRKRRTAAEKEAEEKEKAQKKKEREDKKEAKQAEKAKADAEKQAKQEEKQAKQEEKRRKKEEEDRKIQEEKEKKERAQPKLLSFFKTPITPKKDAAGPKIKTESPATAAATTDSATPAVKKDERSEYEKRFKPFYVHSTVRLAKNPFEMDKETHEAKSRILGEYFDGKREPVQVGKFDPVEIFQLPSRPAERGRIYPPVRYTVEKMLKLMGQRGEGVSEEDKKVIMKETTDALRHVPIKTLRFYQDVRPPYRGTVTLKPYQAGKSGMRRLARKPTLRDQLPVNYEHDSEAEWESEGEDVDIEDDDEEDLDDGDGDMDEFLDDSEDNGPARFVSANGLEPENTGLCWEDRRRMGPNRTMYEHRMEFILESLDHRSGIDPFSTKYWEPEPKPKSAGRPPRDKTAADSSAPTNAFKAISGTKPGVQSLPKKMLENNNLQELKKVIEANPKIAKGGLIDLSYVALAHAKISRNDIKEAIAAVAEKVGGKGHAGSWTIKPGFDV